MTFIINMLFNIKLLANLLPFACKHNFQYKTFFLCYFDYVVHVVTIANIYLKLKNKKKSTACDEVIKMLQTMLEFNSYCLESLKYVCSIKN